MSKDEIKNEEDFDETVSIDDDTMIKDIASIFDK